MSELSDDPELMLDIIAKFVHRAGGYARITDEDPPTAADADSLVLASRVNREEGVVELQLISPDQAPVETA